MPPIVQIDYIFLVWICLIYTTSYSCVTITLPSLANRNAPFQYSSNRAKNPPGTDEGIRADDKSDVTCADKFYAIRGDSLQCDEPGT